MADPRDGPGTEPPAGAPEDEPTVVRDAAEASGAERDPVERLVAMLGPRLDEVRSLLDELSMRWRGDAVRVGEGTKLRFQELVRDAGVVTRADWDELELRVAQIEHRLRLLEDRSEEPTA